MAAATVRQVIRAVVATLAAVLGGTTKLRWVCAQ